MMPFIKPSTAVQEKRTNNNSSLTKKMKENPNSFIFIRIAFAFLALNWIYNKSLYLYFIKKTDLSDFVPEVMEILG